ncbi:DsbA family protein [Alteromonas sp. 1_MG-2023]|uniref:DsbA family protein n=1 Tax=Alteromonas sp. 1_MG-2023 TaxID=3062669 RepID=UPI0026E39BE7|nr:DsbA family protein [Alteromonas sp. 1_MG-2023]MDO6567059.1 DsbA family protein [Alteromonas sp. 1_MG-2023]
MEKSVRQPRQQVTQQSSKSILYYVHDPMCSWCWAFVPVWNTIKQSLPDDIKVQYVLGGLAPDSSEPMPSAMQAAISGYWKTIIQRVPGTTFNFEFWEKCEPRRSTYPSCRAVIAARKQDASKEEPMIRAIQEGYYLRAMNPSNDTTLITMAGELGLNTVQFEKDLNSAETQQALMEEINMGQAIGAQGFPSLILKNESGYRFIALDYNDANVTLAQFGR